MGRGVTISGAHHIRQTAWASSPELFAAHLMSAVRPAVSFMDLDDIAIVENFRAMNLLA
jgi:hypothetical protein